MHNRATVTVLHNNFTILFLMLHGESKNVVQNAIFSTHMHNTSPQLHNPTRSIKKGSCDFAAPAISNHFYKRFRTSCSSFQYFCVEEMLNHSPGL